MSCRRVWRQFITVQGIHELFRQNKHSGRVRQGIKTGIRDLLAWDIDLDKRNPGGEKVMFLPTRSASGQGEGSGPEECLVNPALCAFAVFNLGPVALCRNPGQYHSTFNVGHDGAAG